MAAVDDSIELPSSLLQAVEEIDYTSECFIPCTHSNKRKVVVLSDRLEERALDCRGALKFKKQTGQTQDLTFSF